MALPLFCERLGDDLGFWLLFDIQLLEACVLRLQFFHPRHQGHIHAPVFRSPVVERGRADAQISAEIGHGDAALRSLEGGQNLAVRKSRLLHVEFLNKNILLFTPTISRGDYPTITLKMH